LTFITAIGGGPVSAECPGPGCPAGKDIVDTAIAAGEFTTLASALDAAGLVETLRGDGQFTVFAPTDDAFANLPGELASQLLLPENKEQLIAILGYHVVPERIELNDFVEGMALKTLAGTTLTITLSDGPKVNGIPLIGSGIETPNGILYPVEGVVFPPEQ
jgi:uncharacterized surface protein with fasciclin (FAS1) repeats